MKVIEILRSSGAKARIVGGAVRDSINNTKYTDIDITTDFLPEKVMSLFESSNIKVIPTGIKFGTVTVFIKGESFEITTLRKDIECDGRHAQVVYTDDFQEDASRRDFTINAMSYCPVEEIIYDYFGGVEDIKNKKVVFIGDAKERIHEDALRILRFFRFSSRYANELDKDALKACVANKSLLQILSKERIKSELDLLFTIKDGYKAFDLMYKNGLAIDMISLEDYDNSLYERALESSRHFKVNLKLSLVYTLVFSSDKDISMNKLMSLKFSKKEAKEVVQILNLRDIDDKQSLIYTLKNIWLENEDFVQYFIYASILNNCNNKWKVLELYDSLSLKNKPVFALSGNDIMKLGYDGKEVGHILSLARQKWIESDFNIPAEDLISLIKNNDEFKK